MLNYIKYKRKVIIGIILLFLVFSYITLFLIFRLDHQLIHFEQRGAERCYVNFEGKRIGLKHTLLSHSINVSPEIKSKGIISFMYLFYPLCQIERLLWNNLHPKGSLVDSSMQTYMIIESFNKNGNNITEVDQWGTPLIIQKNTGGSCIISSNGPDKMPNTKDDIIVRFEGDGK